MTLIRELIEIPKQVRDGDFVLKLTAGVTDDHAAATIDSYEVTPQLATAFNQALGLVAGAVESGDSQATYLHGSFGSGKSHFMALLHLLLGGHPAARGKPELHEAIAAHAGRLDGKKFLLVPVHFLDARSMEQKILGGYVERVGSLHPGERLPSVFVADAILREELPGLRSKLGEDAFLDGLAGDAGSGDAWGDFGAKWTTASVDAALVAPATSPENQALAAAYIEAYRPATSGEALATGQGFIDLSRGLAAISAHARGLGYDGIVLFLDELILWLASNIGNLEMVQREAQKLTNLVEGSAANRPVPIVSFVARQRDLRDLVGDHVVGAERVSFADTLTLQSGRFGQITLEARNLPVIAKRRLLRPVDASAEAQLREAVDTALKGRDDVRNVLLGSDADVELFRAVYPFSPALVHALVDVAEALQRERTALKVMLQLLVDHRDDLELGQVIPVGDLWDVVAARDEPFASEVRDLFAKAKRLYRTRLRPMLLETHKLDDGTPPDDPRWAAFRSDDRLVKTALLAALVPRVDAFRTLDAARLAALNWGSVTTPIPGRETQIVVRKLRDWSGRVGELKVGDDPSNPTVAVALVDVDPDEVITRARELFDNAGARRRTLRAVIDDMLDRRLGTDLTTTFRHLWRGTERDVDVTFGNVRDAAEPPDVQLRAGGGRPKVVIDFPFDESGRSPEDDLDRLDDWSERNEATPTVCWLPSFLNQQGLASLGRYVALHELLLGERYEQHTSHLSERQRYDLKPVLVSQRDQLRSQLQDAVLSAYGVRSGTHDWVEGATALTDHFRSLDPAVDIRPTTQPSMLGALGELCDQLLAGRSPGHPTFDQKVTGAMLRTTWEEVQRALADANGRIIVEVPRRPALRVVANALELGTMHEAHFLVSRRWANVLDRHLAAAKDEGRTLTVSDLRTLIDEAPGGRRGLPPEIADLVVLTVAAQADHSLSHGGVAIAITPGKAIPGDVVVRPEQLPSADQWERASTVAQHVFGVNPGAHVTGPEVGALRDAVQAKLKPLGDGPERLVRQLDSAYRQWGLDDGNRRRTARTGLELVRSLGGADGLRTAEVLASVDAPTSPQALGASLTTAGTVADALGHTNWQLLTLAKDVVGDDVRGLLQADELVQGYGPGRRDLERDATKALSQGRPVEPPVVDTGTDGPGKVDPPGPEPRPPSAPQVIEVATVDGRPDVEAQVQAVVEALREHGDVRLTWRWPDGT